MKYKKSKLNAKINTSVNKPADDNRPLTEILPNKFLNSMKVILGDEFNDFLSALNQPKQSAIFVNNKISVDKFKQIVDFEIEPVPYENRGFYVNQKLGKHPLHHAGAFYVQEPSAMFTVNAHQFKGDELVLDMCAAPGGKSIQLANRVPNGVVVSNEINRERCGILFSNIERMGLKNVIVTNDTPQNIGEAYAGCFDVVLVDAPCSGEGMFRRGEQVVKEWNKTLPQMCADRQKQILDSADKALKQNGYLIYSTCTYSLEENEQTVKAFAEKYNYKLCKIDADLPRGIDMPEAVRLYPHKVKGEGQFVAVLQKAGENDSVSSANLHTKNCSLASQFVQSCCGVNLDCMEYGNFAYIVPNTNLIKRGVNYYSLGVRVGCVKDKRFEPAHNFFSAFGGDFKIKYNLDFGSTEVLKYLKGETVDINLPDGWGAFLINGCAVGGFKMAGGKFKNHYPKGLRSLS